MKKKIFFAPKAIRTAIGISTTIIVAGAFVAWGYSSNEILRTSANDASNARMVKEAGVFLDEKQCIDAVNNDADKEKRRFVGKAYRVARRQGLIGQKTITEDQIKQFLVGLKEPGITADEDVTFMDFESHSDSLEAFCNSTLEASELLRYSEPEEFALRNRILNKVAQISNSFDGQGTYKGNHRRVRLSTMVLKRVFDFQNKSAVSPQQKSILVASCVPILQKNYDIQRMFKIEHFRIQKMIDVLRGIGRFASDSRLFEQPKPLPAFERLQVVFPHVDSAWKSKLDLIFMQIIFDSKPTPGKPRPTDDVVLGRAANRVFDDRTNTAYINHFGFNFAALGSDFGLKDWYLYRIAYPVKDLKPAFQTEN